MIILGLSHLYPAPVGHDTTAALLQDGVLRSAVSEERFTRVKHHAGYPANAIQYCLNEAGITLSEVDKVVVGWSLSEEQIETKDRAKFSSTAKNDILFRKTPIENKNPVFYDHHHTHARTAYSMTDFEKAVIISLDGGGIDDGKAVSGGVFIADNGKIDPIKMYPIKASLGFTYSNLTELCGFAMADGEGKTMSLAAFGDNAHNVEKELVYSKISKIYPKFDGIEYVDGSVIEPLWKFNNNMQLASIADERIISLGKFFKRELIAWATQKKLEEIVTGLVSSAVESTGIKNVIATGGLFLNMIMNMKIREKLGKQCKIFFNPICGDLGNAIGVVFEHYFVETGKNPSFPNMSLYLGPSYHNEEIKIAIEQLNLKYEQTDRVQTAIDLVSKGKVIGWFQGRSELGPRGLGNRSILSLANDIKFKDIVNEKVKKRESWRPFCPTIIDERKSHFLEDPTDAPYMVLGFEMKNSQEAPAVCHIDNTCRPQILSRSHNPEFYNIIKGVGGIILNTSLNLAGDPIVETPTNALMTFKNSAMDAMIIGDYLISR